MQKTQSGSNIALETQTHIMSFSSLARTLTHTHTQWLFHVSSPNSNIYGPEEYGWTHTHTHTCNKPILSIFWPVFYYNNFMYQSTYFGKVMHSLVVYLCQKHRSILYLVPGLGDVCVTVCAHVLSQLSLSVCLTTVDGWAHPGLWAPQPCSWRYFKAQQTIKFSARYWPVCRLNSSSTTGALIRPRVKVLRTIHCAEIWGIYSPLSERSC